MNKFLLFISFTSLSILPSFSLKAQGSTDPYQNRVIAKYYSTKDLDYLKINAPEKFKKIKYLFIYSFSVQPFPCANCPAFDLSLVDIKEFEKLRLPNESITITDSTRGFKITLVSDRQLYLMIKNDSENPQVGLRAHFFPFKSSSQLLWKNEFNNEMNLDFFSPRIKLK